MKRSDLSIFFLSYQTNMMIDEKDNQMSAILQLRNEYGTTETNNNNFFQNNNKKQEKDTEKKSVVVRNVNIFLFTEYFN